MNVPTEFDDAFGINDDIESREHMRKASGLLAKSAEFLDRIFSPFASVPVVASKNSNVSELIDLFHGEPHVTVGSDLISSDYFREPDPLAELVSGIAEAMGESEGAAFQKTATSAPQASRHLEPVTRIVADFRNSAPIRKYKDRESVKGASHSLIASMLEFVEREVGA